MREQNNTKGGLRLRPLAMCVALAFSAGFAGSIDAQPQKSQLHHRAATPVLVQREGARRIQQAREQNGHLLKRAVSPRAPMDVVVSSCDDDGPGTLRDAAANAVDGDVIDLTQLECSTITLASGAISVDVDYLTINGPGPDKLTIDAAQTGNVINFYGLDSSDYTYGTLSISGVTMTNGYAPYAGGALWSGDGGSFVLDNVAVTNSYSHAKYGTGGGISADGNVTLTNSSVSGNGVMSTKYGGAGGGVYAAGDLTIIGSTLSGNKAGADATFVYYYYGYQYGPNPGGGLGGGAASAGNLTITNSTISGNESSYGGAVFTNALAAIQNSTITLNSASEANNSPGYYYYADAGGVVATNGNFVIDSSILFGNTTDNPVPSMGIDLAGGGIVASGGNNLVGDSSIDLPDDTISDDPHLLPLADNGGPTQTHALPPDSVAIDAGNNTAGLGTDQRGDGYARVVGAAADIGAYEAEAVTDDVIFKDGFDDDGGS